MILNGKDVSDKEFFKKITPIDKQFQIYLTNYIMPEAIAFYLKECYYKNCLCESSLYSHIHSTINTMIDNQNNINNLIPNIEKILLIKYNLEIINHNPLEFKKVI